MTDNSDLLGGAAAPTPPAAEAAPKRRGRPPGSGKKAPAIVVTKETGVTVTEESFLPETSAAQTLDGANKEAAYATTATATPEQNAETAEVLESELKGPPPKNTDAELDAKLDAQAQLAPVSAQYEEAIKNRVTLIGGGKREYAYQRLLRAGKKL
jgi:hypothetical protein